MPLVAMHWRLPYLLLSARSFHLSLSFSVEKTSLRPRRNQIGQVGILGSKQKCPLGKILHAVAAAKGMQEAGIHLPLTPRQEEQIGILVIEKYHNISISSGEKNTV